MDESRTQAVEGSDLSGTPGLPGPKGDEDPRGPPNSGSELALRDQLGLLERNRQCPMSEREDNVLNALPLFIEVPNT